MKLDILHLDCLSPRRSACSLEHGLIVEPQPQLGHPAEVALQLNGAEDLGAEDVSSGGDQEVKRFDDIKEDFVFAISDPFAAPGYGVCDGYGGAGLDFELMRLLRYISRESGLALSVLGITHVMLRGRYKFGSGVALLLQYLAFRSLRVTKIHHLI